MAVTTEVGETTPAAATVSAYLDIWAAGTDQPRLRELGLFNTSSTTAAVQTALIRASARGTQSTTTTPTAAANQQITSDRVTTTVVDIAWSVQPTFAAIPMRLAEIAGTVGSFVIWTWAADSEIIVLTGAGLAVENQGGAAGPVMRAYQQWEA
jgi:hypothetical protein